MREQGIGVVIVGRGNFVTYKAPIYYFKREMVNWKLDPFKLKKTNFVVVVVLGSKPEALHVLGRCCTNELHP